MDDLPLALFRPGVLADDEFLAGAEGRIRGYGKMVVSGIVEIGRELVAVKERVGWSGYVEFVTERLKWSETQGDRFLHVGQMFSTPNLGVQGLTIDASSLYLIAAPSTPAQVREAVLEQAATPDGISREEVEKLIAEARVETEAATRAEYDDKIVITEEALSRELSKVDRKYQRKIEALEKQHETLTKQRDNARANLKAATAKREKADPRPPIVANFDSKTSFRAMCIAQAIKTLKDELQITPRQLVDIEREMAASIHGQPELAVAKLAELKGNARPTLEWLKELLAVLGEPS